MNLIAIAAHYGSEVTACGIQTRCNRYVKPPAKLLQDAVRSGIDPKTVDVICGVKGEAGCHRFLLISRYSAKYTVPYCQKAGDFVH